MSKGIDATTGLLTSETGSVAVFIASDFSGFGDIHGPGVGESQPVASNETEEGRVF